MSSSKKTQEKDNSQPTAEIQKPKKYKPNAFLIILGLSIAVPLGTAIYFASPIIISFVSKYDADYRTLLGELTLELKIQLIVKAFFLFGLYLAINTYSIMFLRMSLGRGNPVQQEDPNIIKTFNRSLSNAIEQGLIFLSLFAYVVFFRANQEMVAELYGLSILFTLGRFFFLYLYYFGLLFGMPTLRAVGFALNIMVNVRLVQIIFNLAITNQLGTFVRPLLSQVLGPL